MSKPPEKSPLKGVDLRTLSEADFESVLAELASVDEVRAYRALNAKEKKLLRAELTRQLSGDAASLQALYKNDYEYLPVPPKTFFQHRDYLGHMWDDLFDRWKREILHICNPANRIREVMLVSSIGSGKSTAAFGILAYKVQELCAHKSPARAFGLKAGSNITFGVFSRTREASEEDDFQRLVDEILMPSPFFRERLGMQAFRNEVKLRGRVSIRTGSTFGHQIGQTMFGCLLDEINFIGTGTKLQSKKAHDLANAISRRIESRFLDVGGSIPGVTIFVSSKSTKASFTEDRQRMRRGKEGVYIVDGPRWEFNDKVGTEPYSGVTFRVNVTEQTRDSSILDVVVRNEETGEWAVIPGPDEPTEGFIINVPVEHYQSFATDMGGALRDVASIATDSFMPFFTRPVVLRDAVEATLPNPFEHETYPFHVKDDTPFWSLFSVEKTMRIVRSVYVPRRHPTAPRYIHVDLALTGDRAGLVMVHPSSSVYVRDDDGNLTTRRSVEVDFAVGLESGPLGEEIDFTKIEQAIIWLKNQGWPIHMVTFDSYQSRASIQRLSSAFGKAVTCKLLSVDKTPEPYVTLRTAFAEGRVKMPAGLSLLCDELGHLEFDQQRKKVDHPPDFSKDISDGLAGSAFSCLTDKTVSTEYGDPSAKAVLDRARNETAIFRSQLKGLIDESSN